MSYKRLFIFIEGSDDERFFNKIIMPRFKNNYDNVLIVRHACETKIKINRFIDSIKSMGADYIHVNDMDESPCVTQKKEKVQNKFRKINDKNRIPIVIKEIESWYLSGLNDIDSKKLSIRKLKSTDSITKEHFDELMPNKFNSRVDFMIEILKLFSSTTAKEKNQSFKYFFEKYIES